MTSQRQLRFDQVDLLRFTAVNWSDKAERLEDLGKGEEAAFARRKADIWLAIQRQYTSLI